MRHVLDTIDNPPHFLVIVFFPLRFVLFFLLPLPRESRPRGRITYVYTIAGLM